MEIFRLQKETRKNSGGAEGHRTRLAWPGSGGTGDLQPITERGLSSFSKGITPED